MWFGSRNTHAKVWAILTVNRDFASASTLWEANTVIQIWNSLLDSAIGLDVNNINIFKNKLDKLRV